MTDPRPRATAGRVLDQHRQAVMNTLSWADEAAASGDFTGAIAWLDVITAIGDELPPPYPARRASWQAAMRTDQTRREASREEPGDASRWGGFKAARAAA